MTGPCWLAKVAKAVAQILLIWGVHAHGTHRSEGWRQRRHRQPLSKMDGSDVALSWRGETTQVANSRRHWEQSLAGKYPYGRQLASAWPATRKRPDWARPRAASGSAKGARRERKGATWDERHRFQRLRPTYRTGLTRSRRGGGSEPRLSPAPRGRGQRPPPQDTRRVGEIKFAEGS